MDSQQLRARSEAEFPEVLEFLKGLVRIPSVSSLPTHEADMQRSAEYIVEALGKVGAEAQIVTVTNPDGLLSRPAILAQKRGPEGAPTVLLYAHHDVQPTGDLSKWDTNPFEPTEKDGRLYGRGVSDDGAGVAAHLAALKAWGDDLPVTVKLFIEGEEEVGSPTFEAFLHAHQEFLESDVIIVADSGNWERHEPAITTGLRGVISADITVKVADHAVHSGAFGGPLLDAPTALCRLLATLHDEDGAVAVPGLLRQESAEVTYPETDFRAQTGMVAGMRLAGRGDLAARLWFQPSLTVIGMDVTSLEHASNTIHPEATARISLRIAPGQDPRAAADKLREYVLSQAPFGAEVSFTPRDLGPAYSADLASSVLSLMHEALGEAYGHPCVNIGLGGSIPFISSFQELFPHAQVLVTGVEDPYSQAHSENESQDIQDLFSAGLAEALLFAKLPGQIGK